MAVCDSFHHCECASIVEEMEYEQKELIKALEEIVSALQWPDHIPAALVPIGKRALSKVQTAKRQ